MAEITELHERPWGRDFGSEGGSGSGGTTNHAALTNRSAADQHPIGAITGLQDALAGKSPSNHTHTAAEVGALPADTIALPNPNKLTFTGAVSAEYDGSSAVTVEIPQPISVDVTSWKGVQTLVRAGRASEVFAIGDQLTCQKGGTTLTWDIIGIDHDTPADNQFAHSMTLQLHDCLRGTMQYDSEESLYYCETDLAAGTYNFTLPPNYDTNHGGGKTYQFTLTNEVPAGGVIMFPWSYATQAANTKISTYNTRTDTTAIETVAVTEGSGGTSLGTADGNTTNMNHMHRIRYGSNNYKESAIRQFLNSDEAAGVFWTPQMIFDRPPSWNTSIAGFMNGMDTDFLAVIGETEKVASRNTVANSGGSDIVNDKFFLLSRQEVYAGNEVSTIIEGEPYPYYEKYSDLSAPGAGVDSNRIKYRGSGAQEWYLRTPLTSNNYDVRVVHKSGNLHTTFAHSTRGIAPACNII